MYAATFAPIPAKRAQGGRFPPIGPACALRARDRDNTRPAKPSALSSISSICGASVWRDGAAWGTSQGRIS